MNCKKFTVIGITTIVMIFLILNSFSSVVGSDNENGILTENNHVTYAIWEPTIELNEPDKAMVITLNQNQWEALVAVCAIPAFIGRTSSTPLMFSETAQDISTTIPYDTKAVTVWGTEAITASAKLATEYWSKAEIVFTVESYEEALWIVPTAAFIGAPILVTPSKDTLNLLGVKYVVAVGNSSTEAENTIRLQTKEKVWEFQLNLFETKGVICNYVILTNPHDTDDSGNDNIKWKYQSPGAALLAAYRHGVIQTGEWTVDKAAFEALEKATAPDFENYNKVVPVFMTLKRDSYDVEKFLLDAGHQPEYLAAVGGPYAVPNFVYDIHVDYFYPIGNPQVTQYPSSLAAYATLSETIQADRYTKEDLATGRLAAGNLFDLTNQLMRSRFYREYLPGGKYHSNTPTGWETKACFADGHRINQPEPNNIYWDRNQPYHPYSGVQPTLINSGLTTEYYLPKNISDPYDNNKNIKGIMQETTKYGYFHFMPHGGMTSLRIEAGVDEVLGLQNDFLEASDIKTLNYQAPTLAYTTCCKGSVWMLDQGYKPSDFIHSSFIHAGAVAYIATPEIQAGCFWDEAPYAVSGDIAIEFWKNVFSDNVPIGMALRDAKWKAHNTWESKTPKPNDLSTHHVDSITYTLFGDPALEPNKPYIKYNTTKTLDLEIEISEVTTDEEFSVQVIVKDLNTGNVVSDQALLVTITFEGIEKMGASATFNAPEDSGEKTITVSVRKSGYNPITAKAWVQIGKGDKKDNGDDGGFLPGFEGVAIICAIAFLVILSCNYSKNNRRN